MIGMLIGVILYYVLGKVKEHKFKSLTGITILNATVSVLLGWYIINQPTYFNLERWTVSFLCIMVVALSLLNKDGITKLLNNNVTNKAFEYLGGLSLYIYMLHYPIAILVLRLLGTNTEATTYPFWLVYIPSVIITILLSIVVKNIMEMSVLKKD